ncbi:MAG: hypothetical protein ACRCY8_00120 [Dermatophilaceae bacterium]
MTCSARRGVALAIASVALTLGLAAPATAAPDGPAERAPGVTAERTPAVTAERAPGAATVVTEPGANAHELVPDPSQAVTTPDGGTLVPLVTKQDYQRRMNDLSIVVTWWGVQVRFSKMETVTISTSTSACLALVDKASIPSEAKNTIRKGCAELSALADWALANDRCVAHSSYYFPPSSRAWTWDC